MAKRAGFFDDPPAGVKTMSFPSMVSVPSQPRMTGVRWPAPRAWVAWWSLPLVPMTEMVTCSG
jgi:hypothetical protein